MRILWVFLVMLFSISFANASKLEPGQLIRFSGKKYACLSKDSYYEAAGYQGRRELTKFDSMFSSLICANIPPDNQYKILHIEHHSTFDLVEFTHPSSKQSKGMWTDLETSK